MNAYVFVLLISAVFATAIGGALLARGRHEALSRLIAGVLGASAAWSLLLAAACLAPTRDEALGALRALGLTYPWLGPLALHVAVRIRSDRSGLRPLLVLLYVLAPALGVAHLTTPWFVADAVPTSWGHLYRFGPAFPLAFAVAAIGPALAFDALVRGRRQRPAVGTARQGPALAAAIGLPLGLVTLSDVLLPALGSTLPPIGTVCITFLGGGIWIVAYRLGLDARSAATYARHIVDALPDGVVLLRSTGEVRMANPAFAALCGRSRAALYGTSLSALLRDPPRVGGTEETEIETLLERPEGGPVPVRVVAAPLRDRVGHAAGRVLVVRDQREMLGLRRQLLTSARRAAVGEMAAGIAHEVNNPLAFIQANLNHLDAQLERIGERLADADEAERPEAASRARVATAREAVRRVSGVVRDVRSFAHAGSGRHEPHDLGELLESVLRLVLPRVRGRARIERRLGAPARVACVGQDMKQVFLTLLVDAAESVPEGGTIRVATFVEEAAVGVEVAQEGGHPHAAALRELPQPLLDRPGTDRHRAAIGLAIADEVVRDHGGTIDVEHGPDGATRVRVRLPTSWGAAPREPDRREEEPAWAPRS